MSEKMPASPHPTPVSQHNEDGSQHSVTAPASQHSQSASQHSATVPVSDHGEGERVQENEEVSKHSISMPSFEDRKSLEDISSPYNTKDKDFVDAKAFLLQASTLTGLNL